MSNITPCYIYKSSKKAELFLFIPEKDQFDDLPAELMTHFGDPEFVMELPLTLERKLARADAKEVLANMADQGFYLQVPPKDPVVEQQINAFLDN